MAATLRKIKNSWRDELRIVELIEQSIFLVRSTFLSCGWIYYLSTIPFIITLMHFWSIMSSKLIMPFEISQFSLVLTLFFWVKVTGQSIYCKQLLSKLIDEKPDNSLTHFSNIAVKSIFIHPFTIIILIISACLVLPLGYAIIFSQYLFVSSTEQGIKIVETIKHSYKFATQKGIYQHLVLIFLSGIAFIIFINVIVLIFLFPQLLKIAFNIDTVFTQSAFSTLNTTFVMIVVCISYLIFDPIFKACYVNLYFHIKSRSSGEDIMAECRRLSQKRGLKNGLINIILAFALVFALSPRVQAGNNDKKTDYGQQEQVEIEKYRTEEMARTISELSKGDLYRWRYKDKKSHEGNEDKGFIARMMKDLIKTLGNWLKPVANFIERIVERLVDLIRKWLSSKGDMGREQTDFYWTDIWPKLVIMFTVLIFLIGVVYLFKLHKKDKITVIKSKRKTAPNLLEEEVDATELEDDEWLKLGQELRTKGELTLALRSSFLAILSFFHRNDYLVFEHYKTNYNYLKEVKYNSRNNEDMANRFRTCIDIFERSWYGKYPVNMDVLERFEENQQGIMASEQT